MAKVLISDKISESAIQIFKNNNIDELVVDLSFNPGGSAFTQNILGSFNNRSVYKCNIFPKSI